MIRLSSNINLGLPLEAAEGRGMDYPVTINFKGIAIFIFRKVSFPYRFTIPICIESIFYGHRLKINEKLQATNGLDHFKHSEILGNSREFLLFSARPGMETAVHLLKIRAVEVSVYLGR